MMDEGNSMEFGDMLAQIKEDQPKPSFTGIHGPKAGYDDEATEDERDQFPYSE